MKNITIIPHIQLSAMYASFWCSYSIYAHMPMSQSYLWERTFSTRKIKVFFISMLKTVLLYSSSGTRTEIIRLYHTRNWNRWAELIAKQTNNSTELNYQELVIYKSCREKKSTKKIHQKLLHKYKISSATMTISVLTSSPPTDAC